VADLERGYCGVRENRGGDYKTLVYGALCSLAADPIEKKPLFHYLPGTTALSIATPGCNIECKFCQNWEISQFRPEQIQTVTIPPANLVEMARREGHPTIAYTYSEPVVFYEYMHDTAALGRAHGVGSVIISNGYIRAEPLRELCRHLTGVKIDLKAFTESFYRSQCAGELAPVLEALEVLVDIGIHTEIVVLIIPTLNDSPDEIREMSNWIVSRMGTTVPVHFSRFYPTYRLNNLPPTPVEILEQARLVASDCGLEYVYIGNVPMHEAENTFCPSCGSIVIRRIGYRTDPSGLRDGGCAKCGHSIPGVWTRP
jgi:pyruvate formate lyase activating enzyme